MKKKQAGIILSVIVAFVIFYPDAIFAQEVEGQNKPAEKAENPPLQNSDEAENQNKKSSQPAMSHITAEITALKAEVEKLKQHNRQRELAELKADAETAISAGSDSEKEELKSKTFKGGERALQGLNPELSVVGDLFARYIYQNGNTWSDTPGGGRTGFFPRVMGLHFQANLDPFSFAKIVVPITLNGAELGEGYITWSAVTPWLSITLGKFHQQFGIVNRWHAPGLDQTFYPLMITEHFGGPLNQTGLSAVFKLPPVWADYMEIEFQITNGQNSKMFSGDFFSVPSGLIHMRNYWDLSRNTYMELGLTGLFGTNTTLGKTRKTTKEVPIYDEEGNPVIFYDDMGNPVTMVSSVETTAVNDNWRLTAVGGADLTLNWEPVNQAKYRGFTWRSEFIFAYKQVKDENNKNSSIKSWGAYSYLQYKFARNWIIGTRGDVTTPFKLNNKDEYSWGVVPYITWWQSPWVRFRLEYDYINWADMTKLAPEHRVFLQTTFSMGPHKHERY
jgi:hypothetical protein